VAPVSGDLERIVDFLTTIGLEVRLQPIEAPTVLPGLTVDHGALVVDADRLSHVGDVLHEAGHLAVVPGADRGALTVDVGSDGGNEMAALAWSYAATRHLGLAPEVVFHDDGYRGDARSLIENFEAGRYVGVPILVWRGMATNEEFPVMARWLAP
jgi:hypothetical protein